MSKERRDSIFDLPVSSFDRCPGKCRADPSAVRRKTDFTRYCAADQPPCVIGTGLRRRRVTARPFAQSSCDHRHAEPDDLGQEAPPSGTPVMAQALAR
jgi:hypothetical protein